MTTHIQSKSKYPICERAQRMQDILLVSSFGLWAVLLGLSPVLAFHVLMEAGHRRCIVVNRR